jgi:hypothetical protein
MGVRMVPPGNFRSETQPYAESENNFSQKNSVAILPQATALGNDYHSGRSHKTYPNHIRKSCAGKPYGKFHLMV